MGSFYFGISGLAERADTEEHINTALSENKFIRKEYVEYGWNAGPFEEFCNYMERGGTYGKFCWLLNATYFAGDKVFICKDSFIGYDILSAKAHHKNESKMFELLAQVQNYFDGWDAGNLSLKTDD